MSQYNVYVLKVLQVDVVKIESTVGHLLQLVEHHTTIYTVTVSYIHRKRPVVFWSVYLLSVKLGI